MNVEMASLTFLLRHQGSRRHRLGHYWRPASPVRGPPNAPEAAREASGRGSGRASFSQAAGLGLTFSETNTDYAGKGLWMAGPQAYRTVSSPAHA